MNVTALLDIFTSGVQLFEEMRKGPISFRCIIFLQRHLNDQKNKASIGCRSPRNQHLTSFRCAKWPLANRNETRSR